MKVDNKELAKLNKLTIKALKGILKDTEVSPKDKISASKLVMELNNIAVGTESVDLNGNTITGWELKGVK